ncbi:MAG: galactokinase [Planctomycetes bacterium]|nr:galactokinase [Planctomycetota bacterium]
MDPRTIRDAFAARFGRVSEIVARAPGRVNLIGEHTDYNDGFVLPIALAQSTYVAGARRDDSIARVFSANLDDERRWPLDDWTDDRQPRWTSYVAGVAALLARRGTQVRGFDLLIHSEVPVGGGLSSSAALEVAVALVLAGLAGERLAPVETVDLCRAAEHSYARVPCGLMDQYVSLLARAGTALLLDCRSRHYEHIALPLDGHVVLVANSGVHHELAAGEYARRQQQCQQAVAYFHALDPRVRALRDVTPELLDEHAPRMPSLAVARARHVVTENQRTLAAATALRRNDLEAVGRLLCASHRSLRDDYEVSCAEVDQLVAVLHGVDGVLGARLTGGGFGGCVVALARAEAVDQIEEEVRTGYKGGVDSQCRLIRTDAGPGAAIEFP